MKIIIAGDIVPTNSNEQMFKNGDALNLVGTNLHKYLQDADLRICNLEVPMCNGNESKIKKHGPCLKTDVKTVKGLAALKIDAVTLANNHIMDFGEKGLVSTINTLKSNGIKFTGAGANLEQASKALQIELNRKKIGIYGCSEHEFSIATKVTYGANPFEPLESLDHIAKLKEECDFIIVLYHGGKEYYRYPSPELQRRCRKMIDKGADLIICQHSHCIGCQEEYAGGVIVYGQGNFIFDRLSNEYWNEGLLVQITLEEKFKVEYIPFIKENSSIRIANENERNSILSEFNKRSKEIESEEFVIKKYSEYAEKKFVDYMVNMSGRESLLFRIFNKLFHNKLRILKIDRRYNELQKLILQNYMECESHRELLLEGLKNSISRLN